jgi:ribose transport system substrate-binding protein
MRRLLITALVPLAGLLAFTGCGSSSDSSSSGGGEEIVMIPGVTGDDFFYTIAQGAREEATQQDVSLEVQEPPKYEPASQIPLVNAAIAKNPDAILVAATDEDALQAPLQQASDRGIKVLTFDTSIKDPSFLSTHVSSDIVTAGEMVGDELLRLTHDKGPLMYIDHAPGVAFAEDLRAGFEKTVSGSGAELLPIQYFDLDPQKANSITRTTLTSHPDLAGAFVGVGLGAQGAVPALEAAGKIDQVKTVAFDAFAENIKFLKEGKLDAVVSVAARDYGKELVDSAQQSIAGDELPAKVQPKICVLTAKNLNAPENQPCLYEPAPK